jgi:peptide/nickel transport system substrate-binding protein
MQSQLNPTAVLKGAVIGVVTLAGLALAPAHADTTLRTVHSIDLTIIDPIWNTSYTTRDYAYMVYDTLFALDENLDVQPQMVDTWEVSDDRLTYSFTLRDGLLFHDGAPVTSEDVVASLKRWWQKDTLGQLLKDHADDIVAIDDKTFEIRLEEPFALVLDSLGKVSSNVPFIMPKRVAETSPDEQIEETIGSGPFTFSKDEWEPGVRAIFRKFEDYLPRDEPASGLAGGKVAKVDVVERLLIVDPTTAVNALMTGEIDMIEQPTFELLPLMEANPNIDLTVVNTLGTQGALRFNHLHPPFDDPRARRAVMMAVEQEDYMLASVGDPRFYEVCGALFVCGTPLAVDDGANIILERDLDAAKALLEESGYDGEPVVVMVASNVPRFAAWTEVTVQAMRELGMNVDLFSSDWNGLATRRSKMDAPEDGGWHIFHNNWDSADNLSPLTIHPLRSDCENAWFGWPCDETMEELRQSFLTEGDPDKRLELARQIQARNYEQGIHVPLGQFFQPVAHRADVTGILKAPMVVYWNIEKDGE